MVFSGIDVGTARAERLARGGVTRAGQPDDACAITFDRSSASAHELGDGFTMRLKQVIPVQEVQSANQPPAVVF